MNNWSINNRVLFITLFPLTVICLTLNIYFTSIRISEIKDSILKQGTALAFHLANSSEYEMITGNTTELNRLAHNMLSESEVLAVSITDKNNNIVVINRKNQTQNINAIFSYFYDILGNSSKPVKFTEPILSENIAVNDYLPNGQKADIGDDKSNIIGYANAYVSMKISTYRQVIEIIKGNLILILMYLFSVYLSLRLSNELTTAISDVSTTVNRIESGHFQSRILSRHGGELGYLARGINSMAEKIQKSDRHLRQEIEKSTANLRNSYLEIEKQNKRLVQARTTADEANKAKSSFLANISHEIRTPVNGIIGFTDILQQSSLTHNQREYTNAITSASKNLVYLVNDLLDFSRLESGKMNIEKIPFEFYSIFENLYTVYSSNAFNKGVEFIVEIDNRIPNLIISDPIRIEQVLVNLISNAIKFTQKGYIKISASVESTSYDDIVLKLSVEDTGIGLNKDQIDRIFQKFEQADTSTTRKYGGSGLGLSITESIIELLGGSISVDSIEGSGSIFYFTIKCPYSDQDIDFTGYNYSDRAIHLNDPNLHTRVMYANLLESIGFKVFSSAATDKITQSIRANDVFIYGIDASHNINEDYDYSHFKQEIKNIKAIKVALVSSNSPRIHEKLIASGFDHILTKTINKTQLLNTLSTTLFNKKPKHTVLSGRKSSNKSSLRALVVDDNEINIKILETYLRNIDAHTITARNGEEALTKVSKHDFDIIFMDFHMPIMDGYTATEVIRDMSSTKSLTPIIGITADGMQESITRAMNTGMNQCLIKPISSHDIEKVIHTWLKQVPEKKSNTPKSINNLVDMLLKELPSYKKQLSAALHENDHKAIYQVAHKIVGGSAYCDLPKLNKASLKLQTLSESGNCEAIHKQAGVLLDVIDALLET